MRYTQLVTWVLCSLVTAALFATAITGRGPVAALDAHLARDLHAAARAHDSLRLAARIVSVVGAPAVFDVLAAVIAIVLAARRRLADAVIVVVAVAGAGILSTVVKIAVARPRPHFADPVAHAVGMSFPSGHAMTSTVAVGILFAVLLGRPSSNRVVAAAAVACVLLVGVSRLVLGVHYLSDVVAGWLFGCLWLSSCLAVRARHVLRTERVPATTETVV